MAKAAMARPNPPSESALARLRRLHPKEIDLSLGRIERLLAALGHPERRLGPVVHVAGTNGKGSVVAMLAAIGQAAGLRVHVYTSPHLVRFHERIALDGTPISEDALWRALDACERANGDAPITFFEVTTAAAFLAFAETPADLTILETGLGGRLDATNVIARPALSLITPIGIDHTAYLGETIAAIAGEKAGILKPGTPALIGPQPDDAARVIAARAAAIGAPAQWQERDFGARPTTAGDGEGIDWWDGRETIALPMPALKGTHQIANAALAIAAARALPGMTIPDDALAGGLVTARWPARLQRIEHGALTRDLPPGIELWLDGGHNAMAARMLAEEARGWAGKPLYLIVGMMRRKDPTGFLSALAPHVAQGWAVPIPGQDNALSADELAANAMAAGLECAAADDVGAALRAIGAVIRAQGAGAPGRVLICGSLYLAGAVLAENDGTRRAA